MTHREQVTAVVLGSMVPVRILRRLEGIGQRMYSPSCSTVTILSLGASVFSTTILAVAVIGDLITTSDSVRLVRVVQDSQVSASGSPVVVFCQFQLWPLGKGQSSVLHQAFLQSRVKVARQKFSNKPRPGEPSEAGPPDCSKISFGLQSQHGKGREIATRVSRRVRSKRWEMTCPIQDGRVEIAV